MTKKQIVSKFLEYVGKQPGLSAKAEAVNDGKNRRYGKTFSLVKHTRSGIPWITVCFEVFPPKTKEIDGWYEIIKRKCEGKLNIDQFSGIGIGQCSSIEEFLFKLEIMD